MAAPASINIKSLQGKWVLNTLLSDSPDPVLALQGVGWLTRKTLGAATVTQHLKQTPYTDGANATSIEIKQFVTGGIKGNTEVRITDWQYRGRSDWLFGDVEGRSRYTTLAKVIEESEDKWPEAVDAEYIVTGWLSETINGGVVESYVKNEKSAWTAWQLWGFAIVNAERRFVRRFAVRKIGKDEVKRIQLVYDYAGELDS